VAILREETIIPPGGSSLDQVTSLAAEVLRAGDVIAYPTETVYGLGSDYLSERGYQNILKIKGLDDARPFIMLIPDTRWLKILTSGDYDGALLEKLAGAFWPGPVTAILPAASELPAHLAGSGGMISVRVSSDRFVNELLKRYRRPVTSTSANTTGMPPATCMADLRKYFSSASCPIDLAIDDGMRGPLSSTIVKIRDDKVEVTREGVVSAARIYAAVLS